MLSDILKQIFPVHISQLHDEQTARNCHRKGYWDKTTSKYSGVLDFLSTNSWQGPHNTLHFHLKRNWAIFHAQHHRGAITFPVEESDRLVERFGTLAML
jgi:hypothetical protein